MVSHIEVQQLKEKASRMMLIASEIDALAFDISERNPEDSEIDNLRDIAEYTRSIADEIGKIKKTEDEHPILTR